MVLNGCVGIPLDVGNLRIVGQQTVDYPKDEVLHLRVGHVEHKLCAAASQFQFAPLRQQDPLRMFLKELALRVHCLGFNPDAELHALLSGSVGQALQSVGQFLQVYHPVAQC